MTVLLPSLVLLVLWQTLRRDPIYFGGVNVADEAAILKLLGFTKGALPFKYKGIPLT